MVIIKILNAVAVLRNAVLVVVSRPRPLKWW